MYVYTRANNAEAVSRKYMINKTNKQAGRQALEQCPLGILMILYANDVDALPSPFSSSASS